MKKINVLITGSTGMVGKGVLLECIENEMVESIIILNRRSINLNHPKCREIIHQNLADISTIKDQFKDLDACFFCSGISSVGMSETEYRKITYDLTLSFAKDLHEINPDIHFCYVSGTGTDSSEAGRQMWARVKGKTENDLLALFDHATMFRPGVIQPSRNEQAKSNIVNLFYKFFKPLFPFLKKFFPNYITSTKAIGKAMINSVSNNAIKKHLESNDINQLADFFEK